MRVAIIGQGSRFEAVKEIPSLKNALIFKTTRAKFCFEDGEYICKIFVEFDCFFVGLDYEAAFVVFT